MPAPRPLGKFSQWRGRQVEAPPELLPAPKIKIPGAGSSTIRESEI
jgi:hypothetical protein